MKKSIKSILAIAATVAALASCNKETASGNTNPEMDNMCKLTVTFSSNEVAVDTKVAGTVADDNIIKDVQLLVFRKESTDAASRIDAAKRFSGLNASGTYTTSEALSCTRGEREVWVVVNAPTDYTKGNDAVLTLADLKAKTTVLGDNKYTGTEKAFVMAGNTVKTLEKASDNIAVTVKRMACKIVVKEVKNSFILPVYQKEGTLKVTGAYLMSVAGYQKLDNLNTIAAARTYISSANIGHSYWHGKNVKDSNDLIADTYSSAKNLEYNGKLENLSTFYAYPNDAAPAVAETWAIKGTILVIETQINGEALYYPIQIQKIAPVLESNKCYEVSLTIKHPGSQKPWQPVEFEDVTATVNVTDWGTPVTVPAEI